MRKTLILTLCLLLVLVFSASAEQAAAYTVGDTLEGFEVVSVDSIDSLSAEAVRLRHVKSGAQVLFLLNDDPNLGFAIGFHTEPEDDAGMLHILEHASCAASEKYPGRDVFFSIANQAYITDINAWTSLSSTLYYATSMSQAQLEAAADFYLDCAFHSAILTDPNYFAREGWHYEMASEDDPLTINGIVYNEMQGLYTSMVTAASHNLCTVLFPDTYQCRESGGLPSDIPNLTYEELIAFYKECYQPANSITVYYGDVDMQAMLKLMNDGYFADAEVVEPAGISAAQPSLEAPVKASFSFPVSANAEQTDSFLYLGFALPEEALTSYRDTAAWDVLTSYFSDDSMPLMQALNASGIGSDYGAYQARVGTQLTIFFYAQNADETRADEFQSIVLAQLGVMADEGVDEELIHALFQYNELQAKLIRNDGNVAVTLFENLSYCLETQDWSCFDTATAYAEASQLVTAEYAARMIKEQLLANPSCALVITTPVPGLLEENDAALAQTLAEKKAAMTDEERAQLVADTAAYLEWTNLDTPQETLDKVLVVDPYTVEAGWKERAQQTYEENGFTVMVSDDESDVVFTRLLLDISGLTLDQQYRLRMALELSLCSTSQHSEDEIGLLSYQLMSNLSIWVAHTQLEDGAYIPCLAVEFITERENYRQAAETVIEILTETQIAENADRLMQSISAGALSYSNVETIYNNHLMDTALSSVSAINAANLRLRGMDYQAALKGAQAEYAQDAAAFLQSVEDARSAALSRSGAVIVLSGDPDGSCASTLEEIVMARIPALPSAAQPAAELNTARTTAYTGSTSSDYVVMATRLSTMGENTDGAKMVLCQLLTGEYLLPELRFKQGAYTVSLTMCADGIMAFRLYSASDFSSALSVIAAMPEYMENMELTQELVDSYKLPLISTFSYPNGELNDAMSDMLNNLLGFTREQRLSLIEQIRAVTVQDIEALIPFVQRFVSEAPIAVITTAEKAAAYAPGFDEIIPLP